MTELAERIKGTLGYQPTTREANIIRHYEAEIAKRHMTLNTAYEQACADIAGANGHPSKAQRSLKEVS